MFDFTADDCALVVLVDVTLQQQVVGLGSARCKNHVTRWHNVSSSATCATRGLNRGTRHAPGSRAGWRDLLAGIA